VRYFEAVVKHEVWEATVANRHDHAFIVQRETVSRL
jgi:hypothetical protein